MDLNEIKDSKDKCEDFVNHIEGWEEFLRNVDVKVYIVRDENSGLIPFILINKFNLIIYSFFRKVC